jgi:putative flippase GtrA
VEQQPAAVAALTLRARASVALRQRHNWEQLAKFCIVGASGYAVNLAVYALLLNWANLHYRLAATGSFLVAVSNNYLWNRVWTFRHQRGHVAYQGLRFLIVSVAVYGANLLLLTLLVEAGAGKIVAQAIAVVLVTPLNFLGNKLWSFRRRG